MLAGGGERVRGRATTSRSIFGTGAVKGDCYDGEASEVHRPTSKDLGKEKVEESQTGPR